MSTDSQYAHYQRAAQLLKWQRLNEAIQESEQYIASFPNDADGYGLLGEIYLHKDEYDQALHWAQEAISINPENYLGWYVKISTLYTQKNWKVFQKMIPEALRLFPGEEHFYFLNGNYFSSIGNIEKGKENLEIALRIDPENSLYLANYSYLLAVSGENEEAKRFEKNSLEQDVEDYLSFMYLSWAAERRGDYKQALYYLENAIRINPENKQVRDEYLEILQKQYSVYRWLLWPAKFSSQKPWVILLTFFILWLLLKPLVLLFLILYIATHLITKLIVHVKVFGWRFSK